MDKKALLVIDVQNYFINQFTQHIPGQIAAFIEKNKYKFNSIFFFQFINSSDSNWVKISHWRKMLRSPEIDIVPRLRKFLTPDNLFPKTAFSCFKNKRFLKIIKINNLKNFYLCGLDTHACVYCTAMEAYESGFNVYVIKDLCAASHGLSYHKNSLRALIKNLGGQVIVDSITKII
jgi:nicotinamidase-related amidase